MRYNTDMLLTNHTLTGLALSEAIDNPFELAPAAFASHLAIDALPHFDVPGWVFKSPQWLAMATVDNLVALSIFVGFLIARPERWPQTVVGVFFACLPDLLFLPEIFFGKRIDKTFRRFHSWIQWYTSVPTGLVELAWGAGMITLISKGF